MSIAKDLENFHARNWYTLLDVSFPLLLSPFRVHTMKVKLLFCLGLYSEASLIFIFLLCSPSNPSAQSHVTGYSGEASRRRMRMRKVKGMKSRDMEKETQELKNNKII
jgi:hypothetical protein